MDKRKLYECIVCNKLVPIRSKKMCVYCRMIDKGSPLKKYVFKQSLKNKRKKRDKAIIMKPFWEHHLKELQKNPFCVNCGIKLSGGIENIAHILPKRMNCHPEVMDELQNAVYLCASFTNGIGCHDHYDKIQGTRQVYLMPCWNKIVEKYLTFKEKVNKHTKYKEIFEDWIEENIK